MRYVIVMLGVLAMSAVLGGCNDEVTVDELRYDMYGDLKSAAMTKTEYHSESGLAMTINMRKMQDDIHRLLLLDRATRGGHPTIQE